MERLDLNLLVALDALLSEDSVTGAAHRLGLSASAMSRTLARLRTATGDPLLVRAGRRLVPTPRAVALRHQVRELVQASQAVLTPGTEQFDPGLLDRTFIIRASEGFIGLAAAPLVAAVQAAAPRARLRFVARPTAASSPLRDGQVDLEVGNLGPAAPEVRTQLMFRDSYVGAVRIGHPLLAGEVTVERYLERQHVAVSRQEVFTGPVEDALQDLKLDRDIVITVPGFPDALRIVRDSDLVTVVPRSCLDSRPAQAHPLVAGVVGFDLPFPTPEIRVSALWHPRLDADPAHRWLRTLVLAVGRAELASPDASLAPEARKAAAPGVSAAASGAS